GVARHLLRARHQDRRARDGRRQLLGLELRPIVDRQSQLTEAVEVRLGERVDDQDLHVQLTTILARSRSSTVSISRQPPSMNAGRITSPVEIRSLSRSVRYADSKRGARPYGLPASSRRRA